MIEPAILSLLTSFFVLGVFAVVVTAPARRLRAARRRLAAELRGKTVLEAAYIGIDALIAYRIQPLFTPRALITNEGDGTLSVRLPAPDDRIAEHRLAIAETSIAWIDNGDGAGVVPNMVRLHHDGQSHYLIVLKGLGVDKKGTRLLHETLMRMGLAPGSAPRPTRRLRSALGFAALLVVAASALAVWTAFQAAPIDAPQVLAQTPAGDVLAASPRVLYRFDGEGRLLGRVSLKDLGIQDGISDLEALDEATLLVADHDAGVIKRCELEAAMCELLPAFSTGERPLLRTFQFARDPQTGHLFVADTARHRLSELDEHGKLVDKIAGVETLCFPNSPFLAEGRLYVNNTNHHALVHWEIGSWSSPVSQPTVAEGRSKVLCPPAVESEWGAFFARERLGDERARPHEIGRCGRVWPIAAGQDHAGHWWVLNGGANLARGDLLMFDSDLVTPRLRVQLPDDADPVDLLVRDDDLLVTDIASASIRRIGLDGNLLPDFGNATFSAALAEQRARLDRLELMRWATIGFLLILLIVGLIFLFVWQRRRINDILACDPALSRGAG